MASEIDHEERWRSLAAGARVLAEEMTDLQARQVMLRIAAGYDRLAIRAKANKDPDKKSQ